MNCKIGLVSFPVTSQKQYFLNLGEIYDKNVRQDVNLLYEFHSNLGYFCDFTATIEPSKVVPDNIEEIKVIQRKYKLTLKIFLSAIESEFSDVVEFSSPQLYDISCMVPLFSDNIPKSIYVSNDTKQRALFIILPYVDPILRGNIVKNCLDSATDSNAFFLTLGDKKGMNSKNSCELNMRYLLSCGVPKDNIEMIECDVFPDFIFESLIVANMIFEPNKLFIGVSKEDIAVVLGYIRFLRKEGEIQEKFYFICD